MNTLPAELCFLICEFLNDDKDIYAFCRACRFSVPPECVHLCGGTESVFKWALVQCPIEDDAGINTLRMLFEKKKYDYNSIRIGGMCALLFAGISGKHEVVGLFIKNGLVVTEDIFDKVPYTNCSLWLATYHLAWHGVVSVFEMMINLFPNAKDLIWQMLEDYMVPSVALKDCPEAIECFLSAIPPEYHQKVLSQGVSWIIQQKKTSLVDKTKAVGLLLQQGANGYYPCDETPLESAARNGYSEIVQLLVNQKYNPKLRPFQKALKLARKHRHNQVVDILTPNSRNSRKKTARGRKGQLTRTSYGGG